MYACLSSEITIFLLRTRDSSENNLLCRCVIIRSKSWQLALVSIRNRFDESRSMVEISSLPGRWRRCGLAMRPTGCARHRSRPGGSGGDGEQASRLLSRVSGERRYAGQRGTEEGIRANTGENLTLFFFPSPGDSGRRKMVRGCY